MNVSVRRGADKNVIREGRRWREEDIDSVLRGLGGRKSHRFKGSEKAFCDRQH